MRIEKLTASPPQLSYKKTCVVRVCMTETDYHDFEKMVHEMRRENPGQRFTDSSVLRDITKYFVSSWKQNRAEESETSLAQVIH